MSETSVRSLQRVEAKGLLGLRQRKRIFGGLLTLFTWALLVVYLLPAIWVPFTSIRDTVEMSALPPIWIPQRITLEHYQALFGLREGVTTVKFPFYLVNPVIVAFSTTFLTVLIGALAGYSFARFQFRGKQGLFLLILAVRALPGLIVAIPLFILYRELGLQDTRLGLILIMTAFSIPFATWLLEGFFAELPREIEEAARIDGCSRFQIFHRIAIPLAAPGLAAVSVFVFLGSWNEFGLALILTTSAAARTLPPGLFLFMNEYRTSWGPLAAGGMFLLVPSLVFALAAQRFLIRGLTFGAVKK